MIRIERPECPRPIALTNQNYKHPINKDTLRRSSHDKCMYCESKISHIDFAHVEHIKPKAEDK
ncbi:MAG: HNH endonuclease, partial [Calditrichia bacterium]